MNTCAIAQEPVHERELLGHRDRAPVFFSAFERAETHLAREVLAPTRVDQGEAGLAMARTIHYTFP